MAEIQQVSENVVENVVETSATFAKKLTVTPRTIQRDLEALQRLGIISHKGSDKGGYWEVNAKLHQWVDVEGSSILEVRLKKFLKQA